MSIADLSSVIKASGKELMTSFLNSKKLRNKCKIIFPEIEFVQMAHKGLFLELQKKFQEMDFKDFYELTTKTNEYE